MEEQRIVVVLVVVGQKVDLSVLDVGVDLPLF
jgi:hypothetical protein